MKTKQKQKPCRSCGTMCYGTYCMDCTKSNRNPESQRRRIRERHRRKKNEHNIL